MLCAGTYALIGAASFLGGSSRMTVSMSIILLEVTTNLALLPLVMLALLVAKLVGDGTGVKALYDLQCDMKHLPVLEHDPETYMRHMTAADVCANPVVKLPEVV